MTVDLAPSIPRKGRMTAGTEHLVAAANLEYVLRTPGATLGVTLDQLEAALVSGITNMPFVLYSTTVRACVLGADEAPPRSSQEAIALTCRTLVEKLPFLVVQTRHETVAEVIATSFQLAQLSLHYVALYNHLAQYLVILTSL